MESLWKPIAQQKAELREHEILVSQELRYPPFPPKLIEVLKQRYPNRWPYPSETDRYIWMMAGVQLVIQDLEEALNNQDPDDDD